MNNLTSDKVGLYWDNIASLWTDQVRANYDQYRDLLNTPTFLHHLPINTKNDTSFSSSSSISSLLKGLDVGCGEGNNTRLVAEQTGAKMIGIDISPTFIEASINKEDQDHSSSAATIKTTNAVTRQRIEYQVVNAEKLQDHFESNTFDFVTSFMCLMDVPDGRAVIQGVYHLLKPGGIFQFSILHPCFNPPNKKVLRNESGVPYAIQLSNYFDQIPSLDRWWFGRTPMAERMKVDSNIPPNLDEVYKNKEEAEKKGKIPPFCIPYFHRPLSVWTDYIIESGFIIKKIIEPTALSNYLPEESKNNMVIYDTKIIPISIIFQLYKPL